MLPILKTIVRTSKTVGEAVNRFGDANPSIIYHHLKRLGIESPLQWRLKPYVSLMRQERVPNVIMQKRTDRAWSGALVQGKGAMVAHHSKRVDFTSLDIRVQMTDPDRVFRLFAPNGYRKGRFGGYDVWPFDEFPLRKRGAQKKTDSVTIGNA